jgi:hypothetical protein
MFPPRITATAATAAKTFAVSVVAGAVALALAGQAGASSGTMYGDPAAAAKYWRPQRYDDCVLMASADVIGEVTGEQPSEQAIIAKAESTSSTVHPGSIYAKPADVDDPSSGMGTDVADVPALLARYQVAAIVTDRDDAPASGAPRGLGRLEQEMTEGHKVIVSLNAELIWHQPVEAKDKNGKAESDHAVVVTGVDTVNNIVHLNDSGTAEGRDAQVPILLFVESWDTSNELMVVTT